jgi:hypothetical protein
MQQLTRGYNGNSWVLHFLDNFSRMYFVYTLKGKDQTTARIQHSRVFVQQQFQHPVQVLHTNNELTLGCTFHDWVKTLGIPLESSAPYTPPHSDFAERSWKVLAKKACTIWIRSDFAEQLRFKAIRAARYLTNHSPTSSLG